MSTLKELKEIINKKSNIKIFCIVVPKETPPWLLEFSKDEQVLLFPEKAGHGVFDEIKIVRELVVDKSSKIKYVITKSPYVVSDFKRIAVLVVGESTIESPSFQTFGASVNKILVNIFDFGRTTGDLSSFFLEAERQTMLLTENLKELNMLLDKIETQYGEGVERTILINNLLDKIETLEQKNE